MLSIKYDNIGMGAKSLTVFLTRFSVSIRDPSQKTPCSVGFKYSRGFVQKVGYYTCRNYRHKKLLSVKYGTKMAKICTRMEDKDGFRETTGEIRFNTGPMTLRIVI